MTKTLKQHMRESFGNKAIVSNFYNTIQETSSIKAVREWLLEQKQEEQKTYEYLEPKAKTSIIERVMWLNCGAVIDFIDKRIAELDKE
jgi:hypothetical protein